MIDRSVLFLGEKTSESARIQKDPLIYKSKIFTENRLKNRQKTQPPARKYTVIKKPKKFR